MNISAVLVTRGDVDLQPVLDSLPQEWEKVIWWNGKAIEVILPDPRWTRGAISRQIPELPIPDLSVYGRYAAIEYATGELIYVQDDDVIVSNPQEIVDAWFSAPDAYWNGHVVCNMPEIFRQHYSDSALVGFGACFHCDAPARAFDRFETKAARLGYPNFFEKRPEPWVRKGPDFPAPPLGTVRINPAIVHSPSTEKWILAGEFQRTCDVVFTTLTPRVLIDVPKTDREFASAPNRMWKQKEHYGERTRMLEIARKVRDA